MGGVSQFMGGVSHEVALLDECLEILQVNAKSVGLAFI